MTGGHFGNGSPLRMAEVIWCLTALDDLDDIIAYIERDDPAAAARYHTRLIDAGESLSEFPRRDRPADERQYRQMTTVPPYVITYAVEGDTVFILTIRHGRPRPVSA